MKQASRRTDGRNDRHVYMMSPMSLTINSCDVSYTTQHNLPMLITPLTLRQHYTSLHYVTRYCVPERGGGEVVVFTGQCCVQVQTWQQALQSILCTQFGFWLAKCCIPTDVCH